ncbi:MAG TPA: hypothetical protein PLJ27_15490 [Polyangiaceae bacterium]|nr:hypothetical protein [Polyangiaceae bacterium]
MRRLGRTLHCPPSAAHGTAATVLPVVFPLVQPKSRTCARFGFVGHGTIARSCHHPQGHDRHSATLCRPHPGIAGTAGISPTRYIRDHAQLRTVIDYIESNPVKAGLVERKQDWRYGSADDD